MLDATQVRNFDDSKITWRTLDWLEHVAYYVYEVDEKNGVVDIMFKFEPNTRVMLHQHKVPYITLVLQSELRFYKADGEYYESRWPGSYVFGAADGPPHTEGAGDQEAIVFFSNRNVEDTLYVFYDDDMNEVQVLGIADFRAQLDDEVTTGETSNVIWRSRQPS